MKTNFKKIFASITLATMCMVPMTANAASIEATVIDNAGSNKVMCIQAEYDTSIHRSTKIAQAGAAIETAYARGSFGDAYELKPINTGCGTKPYEFGYKGGDISIVTGKNMSTCTWVDGSVITNCTEIKFRGTDVYAKGKDYLNAFNQVAGHAIKTTTVGVNSF